MKHFLPHIVLLSIFITACSDDSPVKRNDSENLLKDREKERTYVDSIETATPFEIPPDSIDHLSFIEPEKESIEFTETGIYQPGTFPALNDTSSRQLPEPYKIHKDVQPASVKAEPFISYLHFPDIIKTLPMRSTENATSNIQYLDTEQGLPSSKVNVLAEDSSGYLWIGLSNGLCRFDGSHLFYFTEEHGLIGNDITSLLIDDKGQLWIGSTKGLMKYDGNRIESYSTQNGLLGNSISSLCQDSEGAIWFSSTQEGVTKFEKDSLYHYTEEQGLTSNFVITLGEHSEGRMFIGCMYQAAVYIEGDDVIQYPHNFFKNFGTTMYFNSYKDRNNNAWVTGYWGKFSRVDEKGTFTLFHPKTGKKWRTGTSMVQSQDNQMWLGSYEGGLCRFDGENYHAYTADQGLSSDHINHLIEDRYGNIWVATDGGGLNKITPHSFRSYTQSDGLPEEQINSIGLNDKNQLLIGASANGAWLKEGDRFKKISRTDGLIILTYGQDFFGNTLAGAHQFGTFVLHPSKDSSSSNYEFISDYNLNPEFRPFGIRSIQQDSKGNLWMCDDLHGLYKYVLSEDKTTYSGIEQYTKSSGLTGDAIIDMDIDRNDAVWFCSRRLGLSKIKGETITHYTEKDGLANNIITCIYVASNDEVWLGTTSGISIFDGESFLTIDAQDGLENQGVKSIVEDYKNRFWIGTDNGLFLLTPDSSRSCGYFIDCFQNQDGLKSSTFMRDAAVIDHDNHIWWATVSGLVELDLNHFDQKESPPQVELIQIDLLNSYVNFQALSDSISEGKPYPVGQARTDLTKLEMNNLVPYHSYPSTFTLPYYINDLTFHWSSITQGSPHHLNYRYRLSGYKKLWREDVKANQIQFSNLAPGKYEFQIQARIQNGEWGPTTSYQFVITPPFWETWWFRLLVLVLIVYSIFLIFRWRNRKLIRRQEELEHTVAERTQEIEQQKHIIEEKNVEIVDSINYAQRIQRALLASDKLLDSRLDDYFVFFQPKDIVSGDFYWATELSNGYFALVTADSTGHGVPGAIMSMLNIASLEKAIDTEGLTEPAAILNFTRDKIIQTLAEDGSEEGGKDGMDCSLLCFSPDKKEIQMALAYNGLWIIRKGELIEYKADKIPVGKHDRDSEPFTPQTIALEKGDLIYTFTDGFPDQFGGPKGKKFKYKPLKELLLVNADKELAEQKRILEETFENWKGGLEQVDDVCIIGVRI